MNLDQIFFTCFGGLTILASLLVISSINPIHSVLFLIIVFCNSSALLIYLGAEFLAIIFIIVYVGAIAILFLFVVMMLNIKLVELSENTLRYLPIGAIIGIIFLFEIFIVVENELKSIEAVLPLLENKLEIPIILNTQIGSLSNIQHLGQIIYTNLFPCFLLASIILLVSMIGAITLTLHQQLNVNRQDVFKQTSRHFIRSIKLKRK